MVKYFNRGKEKIAMQVQQFAYDIPDDIAVGIMKGIYKRFGGVVRDAKTGVIVKHLKEVEVPVEKKAGGTMLQTVKQHPIATIGISVGMSVGAALTAYGVKNKKENEYKKNSPECVIKFEKSLKAYLKAVRKGALDEKTIDRLMVDLEAIKEVGAEEKISLELSTAELKQLVNMIYDYTRKLAKANDIKLERFEQHTSNSIDNLYAYLEVQKRIFSEVA